MKNNLLKVHALMSANVTSVHPDMLMIDIAKLFDTSSFNHLPVLNEEKEIVGVISRSDYHMLQHPFTNLFAAEGSRCNNKLFHSLTVADVMTKDPKCISPEATLSEVMDIFLENKIHCLPVTNDRVCVGMITPYDLLKHFHKMETKYEKI